MPGRPNLILTGGDSVVRYLERSCDPTQDPEEFLLPIVGKVGKATGRKSSIPMCFGHFSELAASHSCLSVPWKITTLVRLLCFACYRV